MTFAILSRFTTFELPMLMATVIMFGGCATLSRDGGFGAVADVAKERLAKDVQWVRSASDADSVQAIVKRSLAHPLTVDAAVQVALLNNRGLQETYAQLGIAEAALVQASRLYNPVLGYT